MGTQVGQVASDTVVSQALAAGRKPGRRSAQVRANSRLGEGIYLLTIEDSYIAQEAKPGQFVNLYPPDSTTMLPRPFGVCQTQERTFDLLYQVVGQGTQAFTQLQVGDSIDLLGPLGHGFDLDQAGLYLLVGGGLGVPPLIKAAQSLADRSDARSLALFGYRDKRFADQLLGQYGTETRSISQDLGNVLTLLDQCADEYSLSGATILTCGPWAMMRAVSSWAQQRSLAVQCCLEERMGCGYGACMACVVDTTAGRLKVCQDGPVFTSAELGWED